MIYEMVTGRLPFEGERQEAVLYTITSEEAEPVTALRAGLPMDLEWIVGKAMVKDAAERYQHVEEMIVDLKSLSKKLASGKSTILQSSAGAKSPSVAARQALRSAEEATKKLERLKVVSVAAVVLLVVAAGISVGLWLRAPESTPELPLRRFAFAAEDSFQKAVISPDGRHIAYVTDFSGQFALWVQDLDRDEPPQIVGPGQNSHLFGSPDSNFIAFRAGAELKKVLVQGGPSTTLYELVGLSIGGGTWSPDGNMIVFSGGSPRRLYSSPWSSQIRAPRPLVFGRVGLGADAPRESKEWRFESLGEKTFSALLVTHRPIVPLLQQDYRQAKAIFTEISDFSLPPAQSRACSR